jgi:hypothetical protein
MSFIQIVLGHFQYVQFECFIVFVVTQIEYILNFVDLLRLTYGHFKHKLSVEGQQNSIYIQFELLQRQ